MKLIKTLIVDDSAFVRKVVREMLSGSPQIEVVGQARDGKEALEMAARLEPDVVTCDLIMPQLDGAGFVRKQMERKPMAILILAASPQDGEQLLEALDAGAVDFVQKPTALATDDLRQIRDELIEKVKAAAQAKSHPAPARTEKVELEAPTPKQVAQRVDIVVVGISTGGPQALRYLIPQFAAEFPVPIVIVLHMPIGYTKAFADKLAELSRLRVREAFEECPVTAGEVLVAPAGRHLTFRRTNEGQVVVKLSVEPMGKPHRPSVDVMFESAAAVYRRRVLAVVMTGMGDDGKQGAAWIKAQGGMVLTESEESCIIYGMPRSVVESGLSDGSASLGSMASEISNRI